MRGSRFVLLSSLHLALASLWLAPAAAQDAAVQATEGSAIQSDAKWITLGTRGGPVTVPNRSQPANLLQAGDRNILVDVGDGTAGQLARVGLTPGDIDAVFISHLHFDHMAGLLGILGLRLQTNATKALLIYGPPGTQDTVDGIIAAMIPGATAGYGVPGADPVDPRSMVEVIELRDGSMLDLDGLLVSVRSNTHYSFPPDSDLADRFEALSFRFDSAERSIVYTGDTGPSDAVVELAQGADLLVAEMMDVDYTISLVRSGWLEMPEQAIRTMESHLGSHHLTPEDVGEMAAAANVGAVVVTHFVGRERDDPGHFEYLEQIRASYAGPVVIASDLDRY